MKCCYQNIELEEKQDSTLARTDTPALFASILED